MYTRLCSVYYSAPECEKWYDEAAFVLCSSFDGDDPEGFVDGGTEDW